jgi:hypothetical protein
MSRRHQEESGLKSDESGLQKRNLYIDDWWKNPEGMHLTVVPEIDVDKTLVTKLEIKKAIFDANDKKVYKARLATDGSGIIVTEPVQVGWMWRHPTQVQALIDSPAPTCERTLKKYKTYSVDYKKNTSKQIKEVFYRFADNFTVNNNFFNGTKTGRTMLDLETTFKIAQVPFVQDKQKYVQLCPFVVWKVAIDGNDKAHEEDSGIKKLTSVFGNMTIQGTVIDDDDLDEEFFDE